jgi:hypothetical protein
MNARGATAAIAGSGFPDDRSAEAGEESRAGRSKSLMNEKAEMERNGLSCRS